MLNSLVTGGQNAAANVGTTGAQVASTIGNDITGGAAAGAAGTVGSANAIAGGVNSLSNSYLLSQLLGGGSGTASPDISTVYNV